MTTTQTPAPQQQFASSTPLQDEIAKQFQEVEVAPFHETPSGFAVRVNKKNSGVCLCICSNRDYEKTPERAEAKAALIVHAVNSRPALLAEVERLRAALNAIAGNVSPTEGPSFDRLESAANYANDVLASSAALAKGGGE